MHIDIEAIFGKERLCSYDSEYEHNKNLRLIGMITPRLAACKLMLRNLLVLHISKRDEDWIFTPKLAPMLASINKYNEQLCHHQYLLRLTLGNVIYIIKGNGIARDLGRDLEIDLLDLMQLSRSNKRRIKAGIIKGA